MKKIVKMLSIVAFACVLGVGLAACGKKVNNTAVSMDSLTINQWKAGSSDIGTAVATNNISEANGVVSVKVDSNVNYLIVDISQFLAGKTITSVTRDDMDGAKVNVYQLFEANTFHGTEKWTLDGTTAATDIENGAIYYYTTEKGAPANAAYIYFGERDNGSLVADGSAKGDYKVVFTASNKDTYTLQISVVDAE